MAKVQSKLKNKSMDDAIAFVRKQKGGRAFIDSVYKTLNKNKRLVDVDTKGEDLFAELIGMFCAEEFILLFEEEGKVCSIKDELRAEFRAERLARLSATQARKEIAAGNTTSPKQEVKEVKEVKAGSKAVEATPVREADNKGDSLPPSKEATAAEKGYVQQLKCWQYPGRIYTKPYYFSDNMGMSMRELKRIIQTLTLPRLGDIIHIFKIPNPKEPLFKSSDIRERKVEIAKMFYGVYTYEEIANSGLKPSVRGMFLKSKGRAPKSMVCLFATESQLKGLRRNIVCDTSSHKDKLSLVYPKMYGFVKDISYAKVVNPQHVQVDESVIKLLSSARSKKIVLCPALTKEEKVSLLLRERKSYALNNKIKDVGKGVNALRFDKAFCGDDIAVVLKSIVDCFKSLGIQTPMVRISETMWETKYTWSSETFSDRLRETLASRLSREALATIGIVKVDKSTEELRFIDYTVPEDKDGEAMVADIKAFIDKEYLPIEEVKLEGNTIRLFGVKEHIAFIRYRFMVVMIHHYPVNEFANLRTDPATWEECNKLIKRRL